MNNQYALDMYCFPTTAGSPSRRSTRRNKRGRTMSVPRKWARVSSRLVASILLSYLRPSGSFQTFSTLPKCLHVSKSQSNLRMASGDANKPPSRATTPSLAAEEKDSRTWTQRRPSPLTTTTSSSATWSRQRRPFSATTASPFPYHAEAYPRTSSRRGRERRKSRALPITGYDAAAIIEYYDRRPLLVGWRLNSLGFPLLGWYLSLLLDHALGLDQNVLLQKKRGRELREHLVRSQSVALIKSGQALSLRPDLIRNRYWAEELGKLVDAVGAFPDAQAMQIMRRELADLAPRLRVTKSSWSKQHQQSPTKQSKKLNRLQQMVAADDILSLFEFYNDNRAVASASIGQVYKARIKPGAQLVAAIGPAAAQQWGGAIVAIKVQRPNVEASASLNMYLLWRTAMWLSKFRGGDLPKVADAFAKQTIATVSGICTAIGAMCLCRRRARPSRGAEFW